MINSIFLTIPTTAYDNLGNITEIIDGNGNTIAKYMYDAQNQLQLEEVYNGTESYTMLYDYDTFGNLLSAKKYQGIGFDYTSKTAFGTLLSTETYGYTDTNWKDLLTSFNGTSITYDAVGNPLSYYNGQSYTFTWEKGKQLANAVTGDKTVIFKHSVNQIIKTIIATPRGFNLSVLLLYKKGGTPCPTFHRIL